MLPHRDSRNLRIQQGRVAKAPGFFGFATRPSAGAVIWRRPRGRVAKAPGFFGFATRPSVGAVI
jgi:hypothetical protein